MTRATLFVFGLLPACGYHAATHPPRDPATAEVVVLDRFSDTYARSFRRSADPSLPGPDAPIDFDTGRFFTRALGPNGEHITQYNLDAHERTPVVIYHTVYARTGALVPGQPSIVDVLPGDAGAPDFWQIVNVRVPDDFLPNTLTSFADLLATGYELEPTQLIVNCPPVPAGSRALHDIGESEPVPLQTGWYRDRVFHYFTFGAPIPIGDDGVRTSRVFVAMKTDPAPGAPLGTSAPVGWATEPGTRQTHNVVAALPTSGTTTYSPLWRVAIYAMGEFDRVTDLASAERATLLSPDAALLNWPVVAIEP